MTNKYIKKKPRGIPKVFCCELSLAIRQNPFHCLGPPSRAAVLYNLRRKKRHAHNLRPPMTLMKLQTTIRTCLPQLHYPVFRSSKNPVFPLVTYLLADNNNQDSSFARVWNDAINQALPFDDQLTFWAVQKILGFKTLNLYRTFIQECPGIDEYLIMHDSQYTMNGFDFCFINQDKLQDNQETSSTEAGNLIYSTGSDSTNDDTIDSVPKSVVPEVPAVKWRWWIPSNHSNYPLRLIPGAISQHCTWMPSNQYQN